MLFPRFFRSSPVLIWLLLALSPFGATAKTPMAGDDAVGEVKLQCVTITVPVGADSNASNKMASAIPEPSTFGLFAVTVLLITGRHRIRRR